MTTPALDQSGASGWLRQRRLIVRDSVAVGVSAGAYGLSFGAISTTSGLSLLQTMALSALMFTGASQFALVGVLAGGGALSAAATASLLGARNAFYGLRLSNILRVRGLRRLLSAQLVIDESAAMASLREDDRQSRLAFWATGWSVFALWNLSTLIGAVSVHAVANPASFGLDAAAPAAFLALLAPRLRDRRTWAPTGTAAVLAVLLTPVLAPGLPILAVGLLVLVVGASTTTGPGRR
ncbi:MAG: AzlC family ABC transporter permease [Jatrophihabitantaceae bacterium]